MNGIVRIVKAVLFLAALGGLAAFFYFENDFVKLLCIVPTTLALMALLQDFLQGVLANMLGGRQLPEIDTLVGRAKSTAESRRSESRNKQAPSSVATEADEGGWLTRKIPCSTLVELLEKTGSAPSGKHAILDAIRRVVADSNTLRELRASVQAFRDGLNEELRAAGISAVAMKAADAAVFEAAIGAIRKLRTERDSAATAKVEAERQCRALESAAQEAKRLERNRSNAVRCHRQLRDAVTGLDAAVRPILPAEWLERAVGSTPAQVLLEAEEGEEPTLPLEGHREALSLLHTLTVALTPVADMPRLLAEAQVSKGHLEARCGEALQRAKLLEGRVDLAEGVLHYLGSKLAMFQQQAQALYLILTALARNEMLGSHKPQLRKLYDHLNAELRRIREELSSEEEEAPGQTECAEVLNAAQAFLFNEEEGIGHIVRLLAVGELPQAHNVLLSGADPDTLEEMLVIGDFSQPVIDQILDSKTGGGRRRRK